MLNSILNYRRLKGKKTRHNLLTVTLYSNSAHCTELGRMIAGYIKSILIEVMFGSTFQLHVCVYVQQITGTHAPKCGNGSWTWRNATHECKTRNANLRIQRTISLNCFRYCSWTALTQNKLLLQ